MQSSAQSTRAQNNSELNFSTQQVISSSPTSPHYSFNTLLLGKVPAVNLIFAAGAAVFRLHLTGIRPQAIRVPLKKKN
jgi:hypothetical protein